jgi:hypothetical protein
LCCSETEVVSSASQLGVFDLGAAAELRRSGGSAGGFSWAST